MTAFEELAASLMEAHYDPRYRKVACERVLSIELSDLGSAQIDQAAQTISEFLS